jgi:hypothetical protein
MASILPAAGPSGIWRGQLEDLRRKITGNQITFTVTNELNGRISKFVYTGTINGAEIEVARRVLVPRWPSIYRCSPIHRLRLPPKQRSTIRAFRRSKAGPRRSGAAAIEHLVHTCGALLCPQRFPMWTKWRNSPLGWNSPLFAKIPRRSRWQSVKCSLSAKRPSGLRVKRESVVRVFLGPAFVTLATGCAINMTRSNCPSYGKL